MSIDAALARPRVHSQGGPTYVDGRVSAATRTALSSMGHEVVALEQEVDSVGFGRVCAVTRAGDGTWSASGEPLWTTAVAAV